MSNPIAVLLLVVLGALIVFLMVSYNSLVRRRNTVQNGWNQIDVQLKRRHDLIPHLVETAKGYVKHERDSAASGYWQEGRQAQPRLPAMQRFHHQFFHDGSSGSRGSSEFICSNVSLEKSFYSFLFFSDFLEPEFFHF